MPNGGKTLIVSLFCVAFVAAGYAWWHTYSQGKRVLEWWGRDAAYRIRLADDCTLKLLKHLDAPRAEADSENAQPAENLELGGRTYRVAGERQVAKQPGFVHARQALIQDASFRWAEIPSQPETDGTADYQFLLVFVDEAGRTTLAFDLIRQTVLHLEVDREVNIEPISGGLEKYFREQFEGTN